MKYLPPRRFRFALTLSVPLFCLTASAAERVPTARTAALSPDSRAVSEPAGGVTAEPDADARLEAAESALRSALEAADPVRGAEALTLRSRALTDLGRFAEATASWAEAERAWARLGDTVHQVEALVQGSLTSRDRPETLRLVERACEIGIAGDRLSLAVAHELNRGGAALEARGDRMPARRLFEAALELHRRVRPDSIEVAAHLDRIGNVAAHLGRPEEAKSLHLQALEVWDRIAPVSGDRAQCLMFLSLLERKLRNIPAAVKLGTESVDLYGRTFLGSPQHVGALRNLALAIVESGDLEGGQRRLVRALSLTTGPEFEGERIQCLEALGSLSERRGDPRAALEYLHPALALLTERSPGSGHTASVLRACARALGSLGRQREAHAAFTQALAIDERLMPGSMPVAHTLREMGELAQRSKDREGARVLYVRALEIVRRHPPAVYDLGVLLTRLGGIAFEDREYRHCEAYLAEAEEVVRRHFSGSPEHANVLIVQGWLAERLGQLERAEERYRHASEMVRTNGSSPISVAQLEQAQGILASHRGDFWAAARHFRAALELRERFVPDPLGLGNELANLGGVYLQQKQYAEAEKWFGRAWQLIRDELGNIEDAHALRVVGADRQWIAGGLAECYGQQQKPLEALVVVEQARARSLAALVGDQRSVEVTLPKDVAQLLAMAQTERDRAQNELAQRSQELLQAEARLAQGPASDVLRGEVREKGEAFERARQEFVVQRAAVSRLETGLKRPEFMGGADSRDKVAAAVRRLPAGTLYLAFQSTSRGMLLIAAEGKPPSSVGQAASTTPAGKPGSGIQVAVYPLSRGEGEIAQRVDRYLDAMAAASGEAVNLGRELSGILFPSAMHAALKRSKRIIVSPDGPLWGLPYAALPLPPGIGEVGHLGLSRSLTMASSLTLYDRSVQAASRAAGRRLEVLAVGDPVFDRTVSPAERLALAGDHRAFLFADGRPPQPLPGTRADAIAVANAYGATPLLGEGATEAAVRQRLPNADVVHLATHGYLNPRWALASGVLLTEPVRQTSGAGKGLPNGAKPSEAHSPNRSTSHLRVGTAGEGDPRDNGALQAWEILSQLKLRADLVVLAACETGRGEYMRGEGLQGLTRSLHVAGARSVVASLWKVRDDSTRALMARLHRGIRSGLPKDEALRQAMAEVSRRKGWGHPFYWAGFVLTGDRENRLFAPQGAASPAAVRGLNSSNPRPNTPRGVPAKRSEPRQSTAKSPR